MQALSFEEVTALRSVARNMLNTMSEIGTEGEAREALTTALYKLDHYFSLNGKEIRVSTRKAGDDFVVTVVHKPSGLKAEAQGKSELQCKTIALKRLEREVYEKTFRKSA